jgi:hypothetical protein
MTYRPIALTGSHQKCVVGRPGLVNSDKSWRDDSSRASPCLSRSHMPQHPTPHNRRASDARDA